MTTQSSVPPQGARDNFDAGSLSWVMGEIREALGRSRAAVFEAVAQDADARSTTLRQAKSFLHQAHGALQIVDIDGVAIITETTEDLLDRLESGQIELGDKVAQVIENAYQALTEYLEELLAGASHQPVRLFPYYKSLLEARGAERVHPADLFFPNLAIRPQLPPINDAAFSESIDYAGLRQRFEKALLPFLRKNDAASEATNARAMLDIVVQVERAQSNQQSRVFWWVMHALAEAVAAGQIPKEIYVKQLFARINLQIRRLSEGSASIAERLLRDALFFIARIEQPSPRAAQVRSAYQLDGLVPTDYDRKRYGQIDSDALAQAKTRLNQAKNLWNRIVAGDAAAADAFGAEMKGLTEAVSKLGSPQLLKLLRELNGIARHAAATSHSGGMLGLEMATSLLFVENALGNINRLAEDFGARADAMTARLLSIVAGEMPTESAQWLDEMSREAQQRQTMAALGGEMQNSLRQVEKLLDDYFRETGERAALAQIEPILHQISGALAILDQDDALRAIEHTQEAVRRFAESPEDARPDPAEFQHVAQNVGALSFFIETLQLRPDSAKQQFAFDERKGMFRARMLEREDAPGDGEQIVVVPALEEPDAVPAVRQNTDEAVLPTIEQELELHQKQSAELARCLSAEPTDPRLQEQLKESLEQVQFAAALVDNPEAGERARVAIDMLENAPGDESLAKLMTAAAEPAVEPAPAAAPAAPMAQASDEEVDAELLEIFLFEAEEVLGCINETIPLSRHEPKNQEHLTTLRRSFHTLKGSGRMVGLSAFGEGAWSVEQVMNLKLAESHGGDADLYALLEKASELLSAWVLDLQTQGRSARRPDALIAAADRVRNGEPFRYEEVAAEDAVAEEVADAAAGEDIQALIAPLDGSVEDAAETIEAVDVIEAAPAQDEQEWQALDELAAPAADLGLALAAEPESVVEASAPEAAPVIEELAAVEEFAIPQPVPVAEIIEFPSMQTPMAARDDGVKYIGDLEISVPLHNIYLAETDELVRMLANDIAEWRHEPEREVNILAVHAAHSLAGSSATVGFQSLQEIAHGLEMALQCFSRKPVRLSDSEFAVLGESVERLKSMLQMFALGEMPAHEPEMVQALVDLRQVVEARAETLPLEPVADNALSGAAEPTLAELEALEVQEALAARDSAPPVVETEVPVAVVPPELPEVRQPEEAPLVADVAIQSAENDTATTAIVIKDELDADLLPVFLEEGRDMLPEVGEKLRAWQQNLADPGLPQALLRLLHTVKGSARMAGAMELGQHMHEMETRIEAIMHAGLPSALSLDDLLSRYDYGLQLFEVLQNPNAARPAPVIDAAAGENDAPAANASSLVELNSIMPARPAGFAATPAPAAQKAVAAQRTGAAGARARGYPRPPGQPGW